MCDTLSVASVLKMPHVGSGQSSPPLIPSLLYCPTFYSIFWYFTFLLSLSYSLHLFFSFSTPSHSTRIIPLHFQAGCHRRRLSLALDFFVLILRYVYFQLKMHACFHSI